MWKLILNAAGAVGYWYWIGDQLTDWTGLAAVRIPLQQGSHPREVTLDLPGYMQTNSYSCGAITAAMIIRYFRSRLVEINLARADRVTLEARHGQVWDTQQLRQDFEVLEFAAPYVVARRKSDSALGSLEFQHEPRFYFKFEPDGRPA
jgi:hypothetical protein